MSCRHTNNNTPHAAFLSALCGRHSVSCWQQKQWGTFRVNRNLYLALHVSIKLIITFTDRRLLRALPKYALPCVVLPAIRSRIILPFSIFVGAKVMIFK